jgi:hypothetical protein
VQARLDRTSDEWEIFPHPYHFGTPSISRIAARLRSRPTPRLRRPVSTGKFEPLKLEFTTLLPGQAVEVQWKKTADRLLFSHWWARVAAVHGPDRLVLEFPQYGTAGARQSTLCARAEVARLEETPGLHGGFAGGVRVPTDAERLQWAEVR